MNGNQSFALYSDLMREEEWTESAILARQQRMIDLAGRVIRLILPH